MPLRKSIGKPISDEMPRAASLVLTTEVSRKPMLTKLAMPTIKRNGREQPAAVRMGAEDEDADERKRHHLERDRDRPSGHGSAPHRSGCSGVAR